MDILHEKSLKNYLKSLQSMVAQMLSVNRYRYHRLSFHTALDIHKESAHNYSQKPHLSFLVSEFEVGHEGSLGHLIQEDEIWVAILCRFTESHADPCTLLVLEEDYVSITLAFAKKRDKKKLGGIYKYNY